MKIGGFQKFSLIDYPGKVSCVIFTQGCNFRCPYCHNRELVAAPFQSEPIPDNQILEFLHSRQGKLQGVVVTGGEPTLQPDLEDFLRQVKALGYSVKLDTNGSRPQVVKRLLDAHLVDFIALDIKAPLDKYPELVGVFVDTKLVEESIHLLTASSVAHQFRTTVVKPLLAEPDLQRIISLLQPSPPYVLQNFSPTEKVLDATLLDRGHYSEEEFENLRLRIEKDSLAGV